MERVNQILENKNYRNYLKRLEDLEQEREFCKHTIEHFLDVARIAYIKVLEDNLNYSKEVIYAIALLHDIGKILEYEEGIPHHRGSVEISKEILKEIDFTEEEKASILTAIEEHREGSEKELSKLIYISDKLSRNCFNCRAEKKCYWSEDKKNFNIRY
ncbi:HD domain-containing protein [Clostridium vincentii]|uniref:Phosphodiesterase n=1 Tax=Clostridium vincentii TaxID=52704 RepID=A0A2T0BHQ8_9CLOT|nr:HD domain-containing protein [Clostridium vincentii]PRR83408.1 phosphodiesterase [Clostridium vincentii]